MAHLLINWLKLTLKQFELHNDIYHVVPLVDDVAYDLAPIRDVTAHFVVNDVVVRSLASVALYAPVELELQFNEREKDDDSISSEYDFHAQCSENEWLKLIVTYRAAVVVVDVVAAVPMNSERGKKQHINQSR